MNKIIIVLCAILAVAYGEARVDDYIRLNDLQYKQVLQDYDTKLEHFKQHYEGRVEAIGVHKEMIAASVEHTTERFAPLRLLTDATKNCVVKYSATVETLEVNITAITVCAVTASTELTHLLSAPVSTRNALESFITNHYEQEVVNCAHKFEKSPSDYTDCVSAVTSDTNTFVYDSQKTFEYELEAAECIAKAHVKKALDCSYNIQYEVLSTLGKVNALYNKCQTGDECKACEKYTCAAGYTLIANFDQPTMANPLYGVGAIPKCVVLNVQ